MGGSLLVLWGAGCNGDGLLLEGTFERFCNIEGEDVRSSEFKRGLSVLTTVEGFTSKFLVLTSWISARVTVFVGLGTLS